jgi:hypothetical protein
MQTKQHPSLPNKNEKRDATTNANPHFMSHLSKSASQPATQPESATLPSQRK